MKHLKLIAAFLAMIVTAAGCSRHPKVDFSVPTEPTTSPVTETTTVPMTEAPAEPGFSTADEAYDAYLEACREQDVDKFCSLFHSGEAENARSVPSKFLRNYFDVKLDEDYQSYQNRTDPEAFRKLAAANFKSWQSTMDAFGQAGESWRIEAGAETKMQAEQVKSFANSLHLDITRGVMREAFCFVGEESGAQVKGESVYLLCIEDKWYPSYTRQCVPQAIDLSDFYPEDASNESEES